MHPDDPQHYAIYIKIGEDGPARFQRRDRQRGMTGDRHPVADQHGITMPANRTGTGFEGHRSPAMRPDFVDRERRLPGAETAVSFLEDHDIGPHFAQHRQRAVGPTLQIGTNAFLDVVGSHEHRHAATAR